MGAGKGVAMRNDATHRAAIAAAQRGNLNRAMYGRARRVDLRSMRTFAVELGRRIRQHRLEQDIPLNELAEASGVCIQALSHIENGVCSRRNGDSNPRYATIVRIAMALGIMPSELMP